VLRGVVAEQDAVDASVSISDRPDISDYQINIALRLARVRKRAPMDIAQDIVQDIKKYPDMQGCDITVTPPGFINISLSDGNIARQLEGMVYGDLTVDQAQHIVLDYGAPNLAKPLHVGHLRSVVIGESLKRILKAVGHRVTADVHLGDWGTQMGKVIYGLRMRYPDVCDGSSALEFTFDDLEGCYRQASQVFDADERAADEMRALTVQLQQKYEPLHRVWRRVRELSVTNIRAIYDQLGASFDLWYGESRYQDVMPSVCRQFLDEGIAVRDDGAVVVHVAEEGGKQIPPVILQKRDGGYLYATTDVATIRERVCDLRADALVYVVDARQALHFEQVFRVANKAGWKAQFHFLGFGTVNGEDGKPFKTRSGDVFKLELLVQDLCAMVQKLAKEKGRDLDPAAIEAVAVAALKVGDLQQDSVHNYVFSVEKFAQFEGRTGPYLLYTYARIVSLLQKQPCPPSLSPHFLPEERRLAVLLLQYGEVLTLAAQKYAPHILCQYMFSLAGAFNALYQNLPILQAEESITAHRLALCVHTQKCLKKILDVLGITPLSRM